MSETRYSEFFRIHDTLKVIHNVVIVVTLMKDEVDPKFITPTDRMTFVIVEISQLGIFTMYQNCHPFLGPLPTRRQIHYGAKPKDA